MSRAVFRNFAPAGCVVFSSWSGFTWFARSQPIRRRIPYFRWFLPILPDLCSVAVIGVGAGSLVYDAFYSTVWHGPQKIYRRPKPVKVMDMQVAEFTLFVPLVLLIIWREWPPLS